MATYILLTRLAPEAVAEPKFIEKLERKVSEHYPSIQHIYFESGALRSAMR